MKYIAATYKTKTITAQCSASSMSGGGLPPGICELHPTRHYGARWVNGSDFGKRVPEAERDAYLLASGHMAEYKRPREASVFFMEGMSYVRRNPRKRLGFETHAGPPAPMRRSWRKALAQHRATEAVLRAAQRAMYDARLAP